MKILKKIGIGCLALVICFCSCFKFVNAESVFVNEPFTLVNGEYELFVNDAVIDDNYIIASAQNSANETHSITYLPQELLQFEGDDSPTDVSFEVSLTYVRDYYDSLIDINYKVFSFTFNNENLISKYQFTYNETDDAYFGLVENDESEFSVYDTIYNLVENYIFGGNIEKGSHQDLTAVILSSIICVLVFALPFLIIWKVIKVIMG